MTLTEDQLWDYFIQRNLWAKDVDFEHLKDEFRKKGVTIIDKRARYTMEDGQCIVFIESENKMTSVIVMPDGSRLTVKNDELEDY